MALLHSEVDLDVLLVRQFELAQRFHELITLLQDSVCEVGFLLRLFGFGLRLKSGLQYNFHVGPGLLHQRIEKGDEAGLNLRKSGLLGQLAHQCYTVGDDGLTYGCGLLHSYL